MQKLALFFLFAVTISLAAPLEFVLAQEMSEDEMMGEDAMDEEVMGDTMMEDKVMGDEMMGDIMMEKQVASPLKQMAMGVDPHEIQCTDGQMLVFKSSNWRPACINESSLEILLERGWVSSHDPSHEDLTKMVDEYMASQPEMTGDGEIEIEEDVTLGSETGTSSGNETGPKNHTVELREDMEMGAQ